MSTIKTVSTDRQFDGLHDALDRVRSSSRSVIVDKEALRALLQDHATMWGALGLDRAPGIARAGRS